MTKLKKVISVATSPGCMPKHEDIIGRLFWLVPYSPHKWLSHIPGCSSPSAMNTYSVVMTGELVGRVLQFGRPAKLQSMFPDAWMKPKLWWPRWLKSVLSLGVRSLPNKGCRAEMGMNRVAQYNIYHRLGFPNPIPTVTIVVNLQQYLFSNFSQHSSISSNIRERKKKSWSELREEAIKSKK